MAWIPPPPLELRLWYGGVLVANLRQVFPHQGTWFAQYKLEITPGNVPVENRLLEYIAFSTDFNRRIADGQEHDFEEFERFSEIANVVSWKIPRPDGGVMPMEGKMWFVDGQVSWQHPETQPSTEAAANELWVRISEYVAATSKVQRAARKASGINELE